MYTGYKTLPIKYRDF